METPDEENNHPPIENTLHQDDVPVAVASDHDDDHGKQSETPDEEKENTTTQEEEKEELEDASIVEKFESLELEGNGEIKGEEKGELEKEEEGNVEGDDNNENDDGKSQNCPYPIRPGAIDCQFYLKTGTCKFGVNCRFNHPLNRVFQPVMEKGEEMGDHHQGSGGEGVAHDTGKIDCKYFRTPNGCKYGNACRYNHSRPEKEPKVLELNFMGLPIRPSEMECTFYMRNGTCAYGAECRYHHPDPSAIKESKSTNFVANGGSVTGVNNFHKGYDDRSLHSRVPQGNLPEFSNGISSGNSSGYAHGMSSYHQGIAQYPGWNQNQVQVNGALSANKLPLPHQMVNYSHKADPSTHYERLMQIEEFPERLGQPDCTYFLRTGDCKYRSKCRYNHPMSGAPKLRLPPLSAKAPYSKPARVSPVESTELSTSSLTNGKKNGMFYDPRQHLMQNGDFPERPGETECEYFMKTGQCKYKSACRYHHPKNGRPTPLGCALNEKGLPLRPGSRICRNYEKLGLCKYSTNCLFHHPDNLSPTDQATAGEQRSTDFGIVAEDHISTANAGALARPARNPVGSDWDDGWAM